MLRVFDPLFFFYGGLIRTDTRFGHGHVILLIRLLLILLWQDKNPDLSLKIEQGFGPNGLGILSVTDVCAYSCIPLVCTINNTFFFVHNFFFLGWWWLEGWIEFIDFISCHWINQSINHYYYCRKLGLRTRKLWTSHVSPLMLFTCVTFSFFYF